MALSRREFLRAAAAATLSPALLHAEPPGNASFPLGVASGYPHPRGCTLWTKLAVPDPVKAAGSIPVRWEIAHDEGFRQIALAGDGEAPAAWGHSVHVDVAGLAPGRWYWYRFVALGERSPAGRLRTAPERAASLRFAFASCQQYEQGYYAAYRHMAREPLDLVVHLGDYIYESSWGRRHVRSHGAPEPVTLEEYRARYALYKSDPDLQAAHAACPWIVTWDDHEVQNDYADDRSQGLDPRDAFLARRAAAYQAYYEHMPLPAWARPRGPDMQLYARLQYGGLAEFQVLDGRQYRSHQVCPRPERGGSNVVRDAECAERLDPALSMLGQAQEAWLHDNLKRSSARWNVIAQQTLMARADRYPDEDARAYWTDGWDGYPAARERLLRFVAEQRVRNPVVIGGDVHMAVVADLKTDFDDDKSPVVASEFCGTSISSQGPSRKTVEAIVAKNPHVKLVSATRRGYTTIELDERRCHARLHALQDVRDPDSGIFELASFVVEDGRPGAVRE